VVHQDLQVHQEVQVAQVHQENMVVFLIDLTLLQMQHQLQEMYNLMVI
jgi:hypothetical protein